MTDRKRDKKTSDTARRHGKRGRWASRGLVLLAAVVLGFLFLLVREVRMAPSGASGSSDSSRKIVDPLIDVAPRPAAHRSGSARATDPRDLSSGEDDPTRAGPAPYVLPTDMPDPSDPPQWTEPLAVPGEPTPPDPFTPPEIEQDPDRGRRPADSEE